MSKKSKIEENLRILEEFNDDSSDSEEDETIGEVVQVNFEGFTAEEDDFHGIQRLLAQCFRGMDVNLTDMADLVIAQNYVGCVIKEVIDDEKQAMDVDEDALEGEPDQPGDFVFGLNTIVNLTTKHKNKKHAACIESVREALLKHCASSSADDKTKELFKVILDRQSEHMGLLINERLINLPAAISLPAFKTLQSEIEEANNIGMPFKFKYVVMICETNKITTLKSKKKNRKQKESGSAAGEGSSKPRVKELWINSEEEVLAQFASWSFEYCVRDCQALTAESWNDKEVDQKNSAPYRKVIVLPIAKLQQAVERAEAAATEDAVVSSNGTAAASCD